MSPADFFNVYVEQKNMATLVNIWVRAGMFAWLSIYIVFLIKKVDWHFEISDE